MALINKVFGGSPIKGWTSYVDIPRETGSTAAGTLLQQLEDYAKEEARGGLRYYCTPKDLCGIEVASEVTPGLRISLHGEGDPPEMAETCSATETLERAKERHEPLCRWQCHLFERVKDV